MSINVRRSRYSDRTPVTVTISLDQGALAALIDNPHMLESDRDGMHFANAVRRGCKALVEAVAEGEPSPEGAAEEAVRKAATYALPIILDACEDLDDDGRQAMATALHTAHERLADALTWVEEGPEDA